MRDGAALPSVELPALASFRASIGTAFTMEADDGRSVEVTLVKLDQAERGPDWETFSLLFDSADALLPQATYAVRHSALGSFSLFVVPIGGDEPGHTCEAVFNRPPP